MKVRDILRENGNVGPEDDFSIEGPFNISNGPAPEEEEGRDDETCVECHGTGELSGERCFSCKGSGVINYNDSGYDEYGDIE